MTKPLRLVSRASIVAISAIVSITALLPGLAFAATPTFTEYIPNTLNGNPSSLVKGPDGRIWFNTQVSNVKTALSALDINTGLTTEYPLTLNSGPRGLMIGPDGNIWFLKSFPSAKLVKMVLVSGTPQYTEYSINGLGVSDLTYGPDGNFWYSSFSTNAIYAVNITGVQQRGIGVGSGPQGLSVGPDGYIWFGEQTSGNISKINPSTGVYTSYVVPGSTTLPAFTTPGPDGNIWFTLQGGAKVGKITPAGVITLYSVTNTTIPKGITVGPDGNIWVALQGKGLGMINPSTGVVTEYATPATPGMGLFGIISGPKKSIWYTVSSNTSRIGWADIGLDYTPPTTSITSPSNNTLVSGSNVTISAASADDFGVTALQLYVDGVLYSTVNNPSASTNFTLNTTTLSDGNHTLTTKANDLAANGPTTSSAVIIKVDNTSPSTAITSPTNSSLVAGSNVSVTATSSDTNGVSKLELYVDGTLNSTVNSPASSQSFALDTTLLSNGTHTLTTKAYDTAGNTPTISATVSATVDNSLPTTSIATPSNNAMVFGQNVLVTASSSDNLAVAKIEFYIDGTLSSTVHNPSSPSIYVWDTTGFSSGDHTLTTKVYDTAGNGPVTSSPVVAKIDNTPPVTTITSPASNSFVSGSSVIVSASSSDNNTVSKLELYIDGLLYSSVNNPTSTQNFNWNTSGFSNGAHTLTTKAYDLTGSAPTISAVVSVTVDNSSPVVTITSPSNGALQSNITTITASASDASGIAGVQFQIDGVNLGDEDLTAPYSISWDTTKYHNGSYSLTAIARDNSGKTATSSRVNAAVSNKSKAREDAVLAVVITPEGIATATVESCVDLSDQDYQVPEKQVLVVDGKLGVVEVKNGATIKGNGSVGDLTVNVGAFLSPGKSPGCLTSENLVLEGTYTFQVGGMNACSEYDQVIVKGTVSIKGSLSIEQYNNYVPKSDEKFTILDNDSNDPISGTFSGLNEGATIVVNNMPYTITYKGGDGNDIVLTVTGKSSTESPRATTISSDSKHNNTSSILLLGGLGLVMVTIIVASMNAQKSRKQAKAPTKKTSKL